MVGNGLGVWIAACAAMTSTWAQHVAPLHKKPTLVSLWSPRCGGGTAACARRRGARGVLAGGASARDGAGLRARRYLGGRMHLVGGVGGLAPLWSPRCDGGTGVPAFAGMTMGEAGMMVEMVGVRVDQGTGSGRDAGQDHLEQPAHVSRQGRGGDSKGGTRTVMAWRRGRNGQPCASIRCLEGGTQTAMPRRALGGGGFAMTRCPRVGTQTVLTRRPGRGGRGYVSTRCSQRGTQAALPRRAQCGAGSLMARCPRLGGYATVVD